MSMMGAGLRPSGKPEDLPPYPKMQTRRISIPTLEDASLRNQVPSKPEARNFSGINLLDA